MAKAALTMTEGEDWVRRLRFNDGSGNPVALGADARVRIAVSGSGVASAELTVGAGLTQSDAGATLQLEVAREVTATLNWPHLSFDLFATVNGRWTAVIPSDLGTIAVTPAFGPVP